MRKDAGYEIMRETKIECLKIIRMFMKQSKLVGLRRGFPFLLSSKHIRFSMQVFRYAKNIWKLKYGILLCLI